MQTMNRKKCITGILAVLCILYVGINVYNNNQQVSSKDLYSSNKNASRQYDTLENIRKSMTKVLSDIEADVYPNLSGDKVSIYMTSADKICSRVSQYNKWETYNGITDPKEMLDYELNLIQFFLGTDLTPKYLLDGASENKNFDFSILDDYNNNGNLPEEELEDYPVNNYDDVCQMMKDGTYQSQYGDKMPRLAYSNGFNMLDTSDEYRYAYYISGSFDVTKGRLKKIYTEDAHLEYIDTYMFSAGNIDDRYILTDGSEFSIKECITMADEYLNHMNDTCGIINYTEVQAAKADVYCIHYNENCLDTSKTYEGKYVVDVIFARKYNDVLLDFCHKLPNDLYAFYDCNRFTVIGENEIDEIFYSNKTHFEDEGEYLGSIIDLSGAMNILSNTIGNNSKYRILNIGLVYKQQDLSSEIEGDMSNMGDIYEKYESTPNWRIDCISEINSQSKTFYIDVQTGKISYTDGVFVPN